MRLGRSWVSVSAEKFHESSAIFARDSPHRAPGTIPSMNDKPQEPVIPDFLALLGLAPPYSIDDVKEAYRAKVKTAHPDVGGSTAEFTQIQEAYERALDLYGFEPTA